MKRIRFVFVFLSFLLPLSSHALDHAKPQMLDDKFYKEYWEQHLLFEDGTFVTSQFLVANFPWPVGKDHGIMVATVVSPDGKRTIIKNGRDLGEWGFDPEKFNLFIHTHRLKNEGGQHELHVGADDKNEVNVTGTSTVAPIDHARYEHKKNYMESSFYLPYFTGEGQWQIRQEDQQFFTTGGGRVQGFGTHVLLNGRLDDLLKSWLRVIGLRDEDNQPLPFLSSIQRPDGSQDIMLTLKNAAGEVTRFSDISIEYKDIKQGKQKSSYPTVIEVSAKNATESLTGTIRFTRKIDHFNINDHLNFFERGFADSRASVANYRYIADYELAYTTAGGTQELSGKALSEYADILPPVKKKKKKKKKRR